MKSWLTLLLAASLAACSTPATTSEAGVPSPDRAMFTDVSADRVALTTGAANSVDVFDAADDRSGDVAPAPVDAAAIDVAIDVSTDAAADVATNTATDAATDAHADVLGTVAPDFMLPDLNPGSRTHRMIVAPSAQRGAISAWYFASAT
jgi:hypothetical protein